MNLKAANWNGATRIFAHEPGERSEVFRFFGFLALALLVVLAAIMTFSLYERSVLGETRLGIGKAPLFTSYYLGRLLVLFLLSLLTVAGFTRLRGAAAAIHDPQISGLKRFVTYGLLAAASGWTILFVVAPVRFYEIALEDGPVESASALLPLASSAAFLCAFWCVLRSQRRDIRRSAALAFTAFFAAVLFVIGMEEISWMQRIFNFETPTLLSANEQNEANLHNLYSSLFFNITYRTGVFAGLILLPFIVETAPKNRLFDWIGDFLPSRFVLAASAPVIGFDYNLWNFAVGPVLVTLSVIILACFAKAARDRGDREEMVLFGILAVFAVTSQAVFLALAVEHTWIISEYRELLLAVGLAVFTWEVTVRLFARYGTAV